jgi:hypothetical protein
MTLVENGLLQLLPTTNFQLQTTFAIKTLIIVLNKLH